MANKTIAQLIAASGATLSSMGNLLEIDDGAGGSWSMTAQQVTNTQYSWITTAFNVANNTTLQASPIQVTVVPGTYYIVLALNGNGGAGGFGKIGFGTSTGVVASLVGLFGQGANSSGMLTPQQITSLAGTVSIAQGSPPGIVVYAGIMVITTGGTLNLGFAQVTPNATNSMLTAGCIMVATRIA